MAREAAPTTKPVAAPVDENIPEIIEERRKDAEGRVLAYRYARGKLLGKVSPMHSACCQQSHEHVCQPYLTCPLPPPLLQGGFAKCFLGTSLQSRTQYALKIVAKSSLVKPRAKQKVRATHATARAGP